MNANSIYPAFPAALTLGYLPNQQRFDPFAAGSLFANQNYLNAGFPLPILPFTLPVSAKFKGSDIPAGPYYCSTVYVNRGGKWVGLYHQETLASSPAR